MSPSLPPPRPALIRDRDGTVRPAAPHLSSLTVDDAAVAKVVKKHKKATTDRRSAAREGKKSHGDDDVELVVTLSKRDRKRLRRRAESYGWTAEEAAAHVLRAWADE